jgi:hypothetical protein
MPILVCPGLSNIKAWCTVCGNGVWRPSVPKRKLKKDPESAAFLLKKDSSGRFAAEPKRIGRPPKTDDERKSVNIILRARKDLRERLRNAANANERSLGGEAEHRLESSFSEQDLLIRAFGGPKGEPVVRPIMFFLNLVGLQGASWENDPEVADAMKVGLGLIVEAVIGGHLSAERQDDFMREITRNKKGDPGTRVKLAAIVTLQSFQLADVYERVVHEDGARQLMARPRLKDGGSP